MKNSSAKMIAIVIGRMMVRPLPRALQVLELPAPVHSIAGGKLHGRAESRLRLRDKAPLIAPADVGAHSDLPAGSRAAR